MAESLIFDAEQTNQQGGKAEMSTQESALKPQRLIEAVSCINADKISPNERQEYLNTLLDLSKSGNSESITVLLESLGPDKTLGYLKAGDEWGSTALHLAARNGHVDTVKVLLQSLELDERQMYLKIKCKLGMTALHRAAWSGHTGTVKVLLESLEHADMLKYLKAKDMDDMTALHCAAMRGHSDTVKVLLDSLAPDERLEYVKVEDGWGATALHWAAKCGHTDTVKVLLDSLAPDERLEYVKVEDEWGTTALHRAANGGHTDTVKVLLESLAPDERLEYLKAKDADGATALHWAAKCGHSDTVKALLEGLTHDKRLECLKAKDADGATALHWAAVHGHTDTVKVLLESLTPDDRLECLKAKSEDDRTALHWAAKYGHSDTVKVLLDSLAPDKRLEYLKVEDGWGGTALHWAANKVDIINYLIESTEPEQRSQLLSNSNHDQDTPLIAIAKNNDSEVISRVMKLLTLRQRFDCMMMQGLNRQTVLHALSANKLKADQSKLATVVSLTGRFAPVLLKIKDTDGNTPADVAETGNIEELLTRRLKTYNLNKPPHVIIFWIKKGRDEKSKATKEFTALKNSFESIGIQPVICEDFTRDDVQAHITEASCQQDLSALIVIIMAHGNASSVIYKKTKSLPINDVLAWMNQLSDPSQPSLQIPKVLIVQACHKKPVGDNPTAVLKDNQLDLLVVFAALEGTNAKRNFMIPILADRIKCSTAEEDFRELVDDTSREMRSRSKKGKPRAPVVLSTINKFFCLKNFVN